MELPCTQASFAPCTLLPASLLLPGAPQVHDAAELGEWVHAVRAVRRRGRLPPEAAAALDELGFAWQVDVVTAKWYHNLHAARHYKVRGAAGGPRGRLGNRAQRLWEPAHGPPHCPKPALAGRPFASLANGG